MNKMPFNELSPFDRPGALKDIYESQEKSGKKFIIKKYASVEPGEKRYIDLGVFGYKKISYPDWLKDEPDLRSFEFGKRRKEEFETVKQYLGEFVENTMFVYGLDEDGNNANFEVQEKVNERPLSSIHSSEINKPEILKQLKDFAVKSLEMFSKIGWLPDIHEDVYATDNIIINEQGKIKLIDTDSIYKIPSDLLTRFNDNLYTESGINPELLEELHKRGESERYVGDIGFTIGSLLDAANLKITE